MTITMHVDTSDPRDVEEGLELLQFLAERGSSPPDDKKASERVSDAGDVEAERLVDAFWERTGEKTHRFLKEGMASFEALEEFSLEDLAKALNEPVEAIRRWRYAAIQRTLNKLGREMPEAPQLFRQRWVADQERTLYWLEPGVRNAVRRRSI